MSVRNCKPLGDIADRPEANAPDKSEATHDKVRVEQRDDWEYALIARDAIRCRELALSAGATCNTDILDSLCQLVVMRPDIWQNLAGERAAWRWARIAAIEALARIRNSAVLPTLVATLQDPDPHIRETVVFALPAFGRNVLPLLRERLRDSYDWTVPEMQSLLNLMGEVGDPSITPELSRVLGHQLPADPARWARQTFAWPFYPILSLCLLFWITTNTLFTNEPLNSGWHSWIESGIRFAIGGFVPMLFCYMLLVCVIFLPLLNLRAAQERAILVRSALLALARLGDKRPIAQVLTLATGSRNATTAAAQATLLTILPTITQEDDRHLSSRSREEMAMLLGTGGPELDSLLLQTLEFAGTGQAYPYVERVARMGATTKIRRKADDLLPLFAARRTAEVAALSLLRASRAPVCEPSELLRPTDATATPTQHQLLHPVDPTVTQLLGTPHPD